MRRSMHTSDPRSQFGINISGFTPSCDALARLLKRKSRMSDISRVKRRRCVWTHRLFPWLEKGP